MFKKGHREFGVPGNAILQKSPDNSNKLCNIKLY